MKCNKCGGENTVQTAPTIAKVFCLDCSESYEVVTGVSDEMYADTTYITKILKLLGKNHRFSILKEIFKQGKVFPNILGDTVFSSEVTYKTLSSMVELGLIKKHNTKQYRSSFYTVSDLGIIVIETLDELCDKVKMLKNQNQQQQTK